MLKLHLSVCFPGNAPATVGTVSGLRQNALRWSFGNGSPATLAMRTAAASDRWSTIVSGTSSHMKTWANNNLS